ncbi:ribosome maturation factor RimM [Corynebacterium sp. 335C]
MVQIGRVVKPHGVRGEVVVDATTDDPAGRFAVGEVLLGRQTGREHRLTVTAMRPHQGRLLVRFEEVPGRNEAESLRGTRFFAEPVVDDEDAYYDHELVGLRVLDCGDVTAEEAEARAYEGVQPEPSDIGEIAGVVRGPAHRLLEVALDGDADGDAEGAPGAAAEPRTVLVPFVHAIVPIVDLDNGAVVITPPAGLLEL